MEYYTCETIEAAAARRGGFLPLTITPRFHYTLQHETALQHDLTG
jgi:hypothetical protein